MTVKFIEMLKKEQANLSRKAFAEAIGVEKAQIYSWYDGSVLPSVRLATKVCENLRLGLKESMDLIKDLEEQIEAKRTFSALQDPSKVLDEPIDSSKTFKKLGKPQPLLLKHLDEAQRTIPTGVFAKQVGLLKGQLDDWRSGKFIPANRTAYRACKGMGLSKAEINKVLDDLEELRYEEKYGIDQVTKKAEADEEEREKISDWQYQLIHTIEYIYGSMYLCPDDEPLLKELQGSWN